jgi:hypothetical protein
MRRTFRRSGNRVRRERDLVRSVREENEKRSGFSSFQEGRRMNESWMMSIVFVRFANYERILERVIH